MAEEASLRARLDAARLASDESGLSEARRNLAARLLKLGVESEKVVVLLREELRAVERPELERQLASLLEGLGELDQAAAAWRRGLEASRERRAVELVHIALLHAQAGDVEPAYKTLDEASAVDESDPGPLELLGTVAACSAGLHAPRAGAEAYVRAARCSASAGDDARSFENILRAFELDPSSTLAAAALVTALGSRGQQSAADDVLRTHAAALCREDAEEVHARRRRVALERGDFPRAFGAALDEGLDAQFEGDSALAFDDMLARAGAFEALAVRLEMRAERARASSDRTAARCWAELGRLLSGPLADAGRAAQAYARSVAADATSTETLHELLACAERTSSSWDVEGLVRAAMGASGYGASADRVAMLCGARALAQVAERRRDVPLASWAHRLVLTLEPSDEHARTSAARLEEAAHWHEKEIQRARQLLEQGTPSRVEALTQLARLLSSAVGHSSELANVLVELTQLRPHDDAVFADALRITERVSDFDALVQLCRHGARRGDASPRLKIAIASALRRSGEHREAAKMAATLLDACTPWAYSVGWISAAATGDRVTRARAIEALAPSCSAGVVGVIAAVAAEELVAIGDTTFARRAAELACRAAPEDARAICALAAVVADDEPHIATTVLERAVSVAGPTAALCTRLASVLEKARSARAAVSWSRRAVSLRPFDVAALQRYLAVAARIGESGSLAEGIEWLLSQPFPAQITVAQLAPALIALGRVDTTRAASLARRALDTFGPRYPALQSAVESVARAADDNDLRTSLFERCIASATPASRGPLLLELAMHCQSIGDTEREVRAYGRAAACGTALGAARARLDAISAASLSPDGELLLLEARAESCLQEGQMHAAAQTFRELGSALWSMAEDRPRAVHAWLRAAQMNSSRGYALLRGDLTLFGGAESAATYLADLSSREADRARAAILATEAARAANDGGAHTKALSLARRALEQDPSHPEALSVAEHACVRLGRLQEMSPLYDCAALGALGRFGRRAAHHRAARFFESHAPMLALKHAAQAFIAVPSEGTTLALLARTADGASRRHVAVRTVAHVAELARRPEARAGWLLRAAMLTSSDAEGLRQRVELLLKAAVVAPSPATLGLLATASRDLVALAPEDSEAIALRLERSSNALAKQLEGPDGARIALTFAELALDTFADPGWSLRAIERAVSADADVDEYRRLAKYAGVLARAEGASENVARLVEACDKPYANVGVALLRLTAAVARALGDSAATLRALMRAVERDEDGEDDLFVEVDAALRLHPDPQLAERFSKKVGGLRLSRALRAVADRKFEAGDTSGALAAYERVLQVVPSDAVDALLLAERNAAFEGARSAARIASDDTRGPRAELVEAAQQAARAGELEVALEKAREAVSLAPDEASTQLFARGLEYQMRGAGTQEQAQATIRALSPRPGFELRTPEDAAFRAFLVAEAEDVLSPGRGEQTLRDGLDSSAPQALVALGLAERAVAKGRYEEAHGFYRVAAFGNLLGLRSPGRVALDAASAAERAASPDLALPFLDEAAKTPETREQALRRIVDVAVATGDSVRARNALRQLADAVVGAERADVLARLARTLLESPLPSERIEGDRAMREAIQEAPTELSTNLREELARFRYRPASPDQGHPASEAPLARTSEYPGGVASRVDSGRLIGQIPAAPPAMQVTPLMPEDVVSLRPAALPLLEIAATPRAAAPVSRSPEKGVAEARAKLHAGMREEGERQLLRELLVEGSLAAADVLDELLSTNPARSATLLKVRRHAVELCPGNIPRLIALRDAARLDHNANYFRAIDHVLSALDPQRTSSVAPPLLAQSMQPGMLTLLTRHSREIAGEAFGIVWDGASALFAKTPTAYRMSGLERVAPGPMSTISRLHEVTLRLLDTPRFTLFHRREPGPLSLTVALLQSPSAILSGDAREDGLELRWSLGRALSSVLVHNALPMGLPESEGRLLWEVICGAFGPSPPTTMGRAHASIAEMLWQVLPPRAHRRLKELLSRGDATPYELVVERAEQSGRRVGMFLTGDFGHAARKVVGENKSLEAILADQPDSLARLCAEVPALTDLFRLAVRPEYADARWHLSSPHSASRFPPTSGGGSLV